MIPDRLEYLTILVVLLIFVASAYSRELSHCIRRHEFWAALPIYFVCCTILDLVAIRLKWWTFRSSKLVGLTILEIPFEEYMLFAVTYLLSIALWEAES